METSQSHVFTPKWKFGLTPPPPLHVCQGLQLLAQRLLSNRVKYFVFLPGGTDTSAGAATAWCGLEEGLGSVWVCVCRK